MDHTAPSGFTSTLPVQLAPLLDVPRWAPWALIPRGRRRVLSKVPLRADDARRGASTKRPDAAGGWLDPGAAFAAARGLRGTWNADVGIGFCLTGETRFLFLDLDDCRDPATGEVAAWAMDILRACDSYAEVTPSGSGLRIIGTSGAAASWGEPAAFAVLKRDRGQVEVYFACRRYVTVTGNVWHDAPIRDIDGPARELLDEAAAAAQLRRSGLRADDAARPEGAKLLGPIADIRACAAAMANDPAVVSWEQWSKIGAAFYNASEGSEDGYEAFVSWSAKAGDLHDEDHCRERWDHFATSPYDQVGMGSLVYLARAADPGFALPSRAPGSPDDDFRDVSLDGHAAGPGAASGGPPATPQAVPPAWDVTTHHGAARVIMDRHGDDIRYIPEMKKWAAWTGQRWFLASSPAMITTAVRDRLHTLSTTTPNVTRTKFSAMNSWGFLSSVIRIIEADRGLDRALPRWDTDPWLLMTPEGVVDLRDGEVREATRDDYMLQCTACPVAERGKPAPLWDRFLHGAFRGDKAVIRYVQMLLGMALIGAPVEHILAIIYGSGGTGKSTLMGTVAGILGSYASSVSPEVLLANRGHRHPAELADFRGRRLLLASEVEQGRTFDAARVKYLTGGDVIKARHMYGDFFEFRPSHTIFLLLNDLPTLRGDDAIQRRIRVITMNAPPERPNPFLARDLRQHEWPQILRWLVDGAALYNALGLEEPRAVTDETEDYMTASDPVAAWFAAEVAITGHEGDRVLSTALLDHFRAWAEANNVQLQGLNDNLLTQRIALMASRDPRVVKGRWKTDGEKKTRGFRGMKLLPASAAGPEARGTNGSGWT